MTSQPNRAIPRCAKCRKGGVTNVEVVALAGPKTPDAEEGDFLCFFHNHPTAQKIPSEARIGSQN